MGQKMAENREAEHVSTSESEQSDFIEPEIGHKDTDEPFINVDYEALEEYDIQPSGVIHELVRQSSQDDGKNLSSNDEISGGEEGRSESEQVSSDMDKMTITPQEIPEELDETQTAEWRQKKKHIFILSESGKPVYSRYGNEDKLVTIMGLLQALVSFVHDSNKDNIRCFIAGDHKFVFLVRDHLILVGVCSSQDSPHQILHQLSYLYNQILSVLTHTTLNKIFKQRRNYDLRRLLSGAEKFLDNMLNMFDTDASFLLGAVRCLPLDSQVRDQIAQSVVQQARVKDLVFALILADNQLVTLVRMKKYYLHPMDLHIIINLINSSESFKAAESWIPICLPKFDSSGYLQAHISYLDEGCQTCLLLLSVDRESFFTLSDCKGKIMERLNRYNGLKAISDSVANTSYSIRQCGISDLRHFLYKSRSTAQFTSPEIEAPYLKPEEQERLFGLYLYLHHRIHMTDRPLKILYHVGQHETLLGWLTQGFELYAVFGPLVTKPVAIAAINKLLRWIKKEEERLFILSSVTF
ncbi:vacuolar fusion protein MON1 homolog A-like isoform X2 [Ostrea edulis]|uniref:vacuolar fusion protein MON1 homolog A-like isoform X2 n=1 Tax=Ostrea edulis TaxID=37623 RepID=UPI0020960078|nr:vacuolar fusion protein MON1 homolog A-like isoform X2 [Ostrea edulis]